MPRADSLRVRRPDALATPLAAGMCALLALSFVVPQLGGFARDGLVKPSLWGVAFLGSCAGWGTLIAERCWAHQRVGIALRAVWGASLLAFAGGLVAMVSGLSRPLLVAWLLVGAVLLARTWVVRRDDLAREARARFRAMRPRLPLAAVVLFLSAAVLAHYLGGASDLSSNPYDDDIAYYPFARQLLDRGTLLDPFSFRRMSTLGGQALYHAAMLVRVDVLHLNVFDRAICFVLSAGLLASHRVEGRKVPLLARLVSIFFLVLLPNTSINSASFYSGLAFFLAFYQTLEGLPQGEILGPRAAVPRLVPIALTGAALCTLRQNYQATVAMVLLCSYALAAHRLRRIRPLVLEGAICLGLVGVFVLPWLVLLYRSNDTFLFPLMKGTFRAGVAVQSHGMSPMRFARFFAEVWLGPDPIQTLPLFFLVGLAAREVSTRRPLAAQWLGAFGSIVMLSLAFSLADAGNLGRYDYGFVTASAFLTWQAVATNAASRTRDSSFARAAPVALLVFALAAPALDPANSTRAKKMIATRLRDADEMLRRTVPAQKEPPIASLSSTLGS